ncbi:MAG: hypothetical protein KatS3mg040_1841 [Candidatus Kapaibacterium sp.]|nr:MAG: hypothetical protein KatS3mg040_1841 [Candidatus Kapabacteria bacterium]
MCSPKVRTCKTPTSSSTTTCPGRSFASFSAPAAWTVSARSTTPSSVYSFLPADGVERIIRLAPGAFPIGCQQNQEVIGTDETFFGEEAANKLRDLYTEKAGRRSTMTHPDEDIDLASLALQVWNSASADDPKEAAATCRPSSRLRARSLRLPIQRSIRPV